MGFLLSRPQKKIWQAVALSLGIDPDKMNQSRDYWRHLLALPVDGRKRDFFVKSVIRARCAHNHPVKMRASIFEKAWDRMMSSVPQRLRYAGQ